MASAWVGRNSGLLNYSTISPTDAELPKAGNRFDVPGGGVLYAATTRAGCFVETLARFASSGRWQL
ncbi:MAG: RES domain-containing protein [Nocardioidaceae bacterium]